MFASSLRHASTAMATAYLCTLLGSRIRTISYVLLHITGQRWNGNRTRLRMCICNRSSEPTMSRRVHSLYFVIRCRHLPFPATSLWHTKTLNHRFLRAE